MEQDEEMKSGESGDENASAENESDDDDDSKELEADDEANEQLLMNLEKEVSDNVYDYQRHLSLIEGLRKAGELDRLRQARQRFAAMFPLAPKLWLEWINDERRIESPWEEIRALFDSAVRDYLSVDVWLEYVQFACGKLAPAELRNLCEIALSRAGLHVADGRLLWDAYRIFEAALAVPNGDDKPSSASMDLLFQIFKRQLSIPLIGLEETQQEFVNIFGEEKFDPVIRQAYDSAIEELRTLTGYETELQSTSNSLDTYWRYLDYEEGVSSITGSGDHNEKDKIKEKKITNVARLQCVFERAITDHCLSVDLWARYVSWLDKRFTSTASIVEVVLPVYERAVRNCSWSATLWIKYALCCERSGVIDWCERADNVLKRATNDGCYTSASEAAEIWLTWAYQKRRATDAGLCGQDAVAETFEKGATFLKEKFGDRGWDPSCAYRRSWASCLARRLKRDTRNDATTPDLLTKVRALWKDILASEGNGRLASVWLDYFNRVERPFGDANQARKTLYTALNSATDFPAYVATTLKEFELEEGSLRDLDEAEERIRKQSARLEERKKQQQALITSSKQKQRGGVGAMVRNEKRAELNERKAEKRKNVDGEDTPPKKQQRMVQQIPTKSSPRPKISIDREKAVSAMPVSLGKKTEFKSDDERLRRTVFVSNLSFALNEDRLKEAFESENVGKVTEVQLRKHVSGRSLGYGFVEFESEESVEKALALDRHRIDGRPMYVSEHKKRDGGGEGGQKRTEIPDGAGGGKNAASEKYHFGAGMEKHKLFVRNIPKHATETDLKTIFEPYGELKSVRLVTFPSGQSKGIAYVEYTNEEDAAQALLNTDGSVLFQKDLSVAISNPPPRRQGASSGRPSFVPKQFLKSAPVRKDDQQDQKLMPPPAPKMLLPRSVGSATVRKQKLDLG